MSEIEEGDQVVTTEGEVDQVVKVTEIPDPCGPQVWLKEREIHLGQDKLIKVDQPIRVKVSRECYAESLVALAEEHEFDKHWSFTKNEIVTAGCLEIRLQPKHIYPTPNHDLTYAQDLPQIEAWLECHSESEDECDVRTCTDGYVMGQGHIHPCPECNPDVKCEVCEDQDCTDESDVEENFNPCDGEPLKSNTDEFDNTMSVDDDDERWIQNESEEYDEPRPEDEKLQDVRESKETLENIKEFHKNKHDSYKDSFVREYKKNRRLREQIEEAIRYYRDHEILKDADYEQIAENMHDILTDSDEENDFSEKD